MLAIVSSSNNYIIVGIIIYLNLTTYSGAHSPDGLDLHYEQMTLASKIYEEPVT